MAVQVAGTPAEQVEQGSASAVELEQGALLTFRPCPFLLPVGDEQAFLCAQQLERGEEAIRYDPHSDRASGFSKQSAAEADRLRGILANATDQATRWLSRILPAYAAGWELERVAFHPEEEATRALSQSQRNDLLHIDAAREHPTDGRRMLRLFVNLHPTDPRGWLTSLAFKDLLPRMASRVGLTPEPAPTWTKPWTLVQRVIAGQNAGRPPYDAFMVRLHDFLKSYDRFQDRSAKKCWHFDPGTAWLLFTDGLCHAELRGRCVLELGFLVPRNCLAAPDIAPIALFEQASAIPPA